MDLGLNGKVALVTGASAGLGRGIALMLAKEGCRVAIAARREPLLATLAQEIAAAGGPPPLVCIADITDPETPQRLSRDVVDGLGPIDILVNNAGGSRPFEALGTRDQWDEAMTLNFHAGRELAHACVGDMQARGFGRIINITGADEATGLNAGMAPNGAVNIWSKALSRFAGKDGVTVNCIAPGRIHSEQIDNRLLPTPEAQRKWVAENCPAGYIGEPADLAVLVAFLSSPLARYINGQVIYVDGGARRFPH